MVFWRLPLTELSTSGRPRRCYWSTPHRSPARFIPVLSTAAVAFSEARKAMSRLAASGSFAPSTAIFALINASLAENDEPQSYGGISRVINGRPQGVFSTEELRRFREQSATLQSFDASSGRKRLILGPLRQEAMRAKPARDSSAGNRPCWAEALRRKRSCRGCSGSDGRFRVLESAICGRHRRAVQNSSTQRARPDNRWSR